MTLSDAPALTPSVESVAHTLAAMIDGPWPRTEATAHAWLRSHGLDPDTATERPRHQPGENRAWDRGTMRGWGETEAGWGTFAGEFVGVNWFLWRGASSDQVMTAARALADAVTATHGAPTEAIESTEHGGTWLWRLPGHIIDLYAYNGLPRADGFPAGDACVQLHLDHRERSDAREAQAKPSRTPRTVSRGTSACRARAAPSDDRWARHTAHRRRPA